MFYKFLLLLCLTPAAGCRLLGGKRDFKAKPAERAGQKTDSGALQLLQSAGLAAINSPLEFKGLQIFKKNKVYKGLRVGGLSEIVFDKVSGRFYALSDDKKDHRFYQLALKTKPQYHFEIISQVRLKSPESDKLEINMDPEALIFYGKDKIFIASEGQQIFKIHEPAQIFTFNRKGALKEAWPVPSVFWKKGESPQPKGFGQQENKGFESLALDKNSGLLWAGLEKPLKQDLIFKNKAVVRLSAFDIKTKKMLAQYGYALENKGQGGLTALRFLKPKVFISLERAYKKQKKSGVNEVQLFIADCRRAENIQKYIQLPQSFKACVKKKLWDSSEDSSSLRIDNLEGLALGPKRRGQKRLLVLVSDNNFNEESQETQFLFFEMNLNRLF